METQIIYLVFVTKPNAEKELLYTCDNIAQAINAANEYNESSLTNQFMKHLTILASGAVHNTWAEWDTYRFDIERHEVGKYAYNYGTF